MERLEVRFARGGQLQLTSLDFLFLMSLTLMRDIAKRERRDASLPPAEDSSPKGRPTLNPLRDGPLVFSAQAPAGDHKFLS